jgi:effector-binding domain-containing protein
MNFILFLGILIIIVTIVGLSVGTFRKPHIEKSTSPGYELLGIPYQGPYQKIGPAIKRIATMAKNKGIQPEIVAVYFDNPRDVKESECRALAAIKVSPEQAAILKSENLEGLTIPSGNAIVCHWKGKALPTRIMGAIRVYPKLNQYVVQNDLYEKVNFVYEVYEPQETIFVMQYNN